MTLLRLLKLQDDAVLTANILDSNVMLAKPAISLDLSSKNNNVTKYKQQMLN